MLLGINPALPVFTGGGKENAVTGRRFAVQAALPDVLAPNAAGVYLKDQDGNISDPSGRVLFKAAPGIDVSTEGTILDSSVPVGSLIYYGGADWAIRPSVDMIGLMSGLGNRMIDNILDFMSFKANLKLVGIMDENMGTVLNMKA